MSEDKVEVPVVVDVTSEPPKTDSEIIEVKKQQIEKQIIYYPHTEQIDLTSIDPQTEAIDLSQSRLKEIESFSKFLNLKSISFRQNFLKTLVSENLKADKGFDQIKDLDFYDNQIEVIENLNELITLENLDLSFNHFTKIENLECLVGLKKLYLVHNKITKLENLEPFQCLEMLELGDNQIRNIENLNVLKNLKELYLGKNKIRQLNNLDLPNLQILSIQSNRITELKGLENLPNLQELYMSDNGLTKIEGLDALSNLKVLDFSNNRIERIKNISGLKNLEELWFSNNFLSFWTDIELLRELPKLKCLYLEQNPLYYISNKKPSVVVTNNQVNNADYRRKIIMTLPNLEQIDATVCPPKKN